jgi:protein NRD1
MPYSPPHRPSVADQPDVVDAEAPPSHPGVDEFGREIRPSSDDDGSMTPDDLKQRPAQSLPAVTAPLAPGVVETVPDSGERVSPATAPPQTATAASATSSGVDDEIHQDKGQSGLQSFDYTTFDPTSPPSWEALGQAWAVTNGRPPTQEELMMFVMEITVSMASQAPAPTPAPPSGPPMQGNQRTGYAGGWMGEPRGGPPRGGGRGRGAFGTRGGRGGFAYGHSGDGQARWDHGGDGYAGSTDAIVLGEHTNAQNGLDWAQGSHEQAQADLDEEGGGQEENPSVSGGRMQKVGEEKWVFMRNDGSS